MKKNNSSPKNRVDKLTKLQLLHLEQLNYVAGGWGQPGHFNK